ncbi:hypothetical protein COLO4_20365 [Corchorus olitorius]|uniref:Uncharacterized protein n=1 Tax=Corchorus olitorius TaxID=93759 RepID=A0A1R3J073_9ROSI|nr:hypothetical protein COLO4_20365 [Corchorus olitorius]
MAIWRTPCQILLLLSFLLLNKSFFLEAAESHSTRKIGSCIENERKALLELKTTLNDPSGLLSSWVGKNCCNWTGISCSDETGNVVKLDLKNFNLCSLCTPLNQSQQGGTLNLSFLNLPYLSYLDISWNNFQGIHIPKFIGSLKNLQYLDLSENNFIGKVPPSLGNLSNLEYLDLSHSSNLWASDLNWLSGLTSIKYLGLNGLNLSLAGANWLQAVNMLPSLTELHLADCELNTSVPELEFVNFSSLQVLDLSNNNFSSSMPSWLFNISTLCNLQRIDLSDNKISGDIYEFMEALARCSNNTLTHIDLSSNHLKGNLPESIGSLRNLEDLLLTRNSFSGSFPMLIGNLSSLERLDLSFNSMNGIIPESIGQLTSLYQLDLFGNSWEGIITENHFRNLSSLFYFSLSSISKSVIFNLSQDWIPCFSLVELAVSDCQLGPAFPSWLTTQTDHLSQLTLSSAGISDAIPDWFWSLASRLSFVDLSDNQLTGKLPKLASFDGSMDLGFNLLEGSIPIWPNVISLSLRNNLFSGPIPSNIGQGMLNVEALDLSRNFLNGSIPASINNMASLRFLDLSSNDLSGLIPNQLLGLQNLMTLDLSKNNLSGPSSLCSLPSLLFLNLKGNNLSGELAATLQNCSGGLNIIDLGENQFSGIIPGTVLGNLSYLYYLGLRANLLTGSIPQELCKFTGLHIIDLAQNNLSGAIPECLGNLEAFTTLLPYLSDIPLTEDISFEEHVEMVSKSRKNEFRKIIDLVNAIDLSSNNLVGEIPDHLTKLSQLGTLNLSWNHLTGRIPDNIGNLRRLETLDLSHNNLSGTIPPSMSSMTLLNYLNVSFNNLSGQIPTSNQFQTFNDPSIYQGNPKLCGPPLLTRCSPLSKGKGEDNNGESEDEDKYYKFWFYVSMGLGFIVGFWVVCGSLLIKQTWRRAYFKFVDETKDRLFVVIRSIISRFPKEDCGRMMMCLR